ncbi:MAG: hypothetical protein ABIS39_03045 [Sphingomicrobium sp.]
MDDSAPSFAELAADPEIAPLLNFTPVPRSHAKANGWTAEMQRMFIAWLAYYGSPTNACDELGKARSGIDKVYKAPEAAEFRAAWEAAVALAEKRRIAQLTTRHGGAGAMRAPTMSRRKPERTDLDAKGRAPLPGQLLNEYGEWEDENSYLRRGEEAKESIAGKLLRIRRMFLQEISGCPGKRAAFEILTKLPIDWDKAARLEPQDDEPYRTSNQREPDMVLMAESGWSFGQQGYGPEKMAELYREVDKIRAAEGLPAIDWETESAERSDAGEAR